jgi:hypothetical protein
MMFNGESKGRVVSSSGRKRDLSRNSVIEESRKQREQRALDKRRMNATLVIQKNYRRYFFQKQLRKEIKSNLDQQLAKISQIESLIPNFTLPFESVLLLMKYAVVSRVIEEPEKWKNIITRVTKSFRSPSSLKDWKMKLNDKANIHSFQIILTSFCRDFLAVMRDSNYPQITEFLSSLIIMIEPKPLSDLESLFIRNCIQGVFQLLRDLPYRFLRDIAISNQPISAELETLSVTLLCLCETFLFGDIPLIDIPVLGSGQYSWVGFATSILSIPNLFKSPWALKYLTRYHSYERIDELSHHWNSALTSISSLMISQLETIGLASNFFTVVSDSHGELLQRFPPHLWKNLLAKSLQDDLLLLKAVLLYHDLHTNEEEEEEEEDDSGSVDEIGSLATLDKRISYSQGKLVSSIQSNEEAVPLLVSILKSMLQPSLLRSWLGTISRDSGELLKEDADLLVLFSRLLIFTPPPLLLGNQLSSQSVSSGLRTLAYLPVQFL